MLEFSAGKPAFDVTMLALHVQKRLAHKGKWLEDLRPYLADPLQSSPDIDWADFNAAGLKPDLGLFQAVVVAHVSGAGIFQ